MRAHGIVEIPTLMIDGIIMPFPLPLVEHSAACSRGRTRDWPPHERHIKLTAHYAACKVGCVKIVCSQMLENVQMISGGSPSSEV